MKKQITCVDKQRAHQFTMGRDESPERVLGNTAISAFIVLKGFLYFCTHVFSTSSKVFCSPFAYNPQIHIASRTRMLTPFFPPPSSTAITPTPNAVNTSRPPKIRIFTRIGPGRPPPPPSVTVCPAEFDPVQSRSRKPPYSLFPTRPLHVVFGL